MASSNAPPLQGIRVVELAGLAPVPYAGLLLAQYGASVLRIDRPHPHAHSSSHTPPFTPDFLTERKSSIALNLKSPSSLALLHSLLPTVDVLIEPFRPGVLESLGLAPTELLKRNPRLIVARLTGFRRDGKYASMAGHDINYLAVSGILSMLGPRANPNPPANLLADFAGGGLTCAFGIVMALFARERSGKGQVVESNMVDGVGSLSSMMRLGRKTPMWDWPRGENVLDGGAPWYGVYETKDGGWMSVGALEPHFFTQLVKGLGLDGKGLEKMRGLDDRKRWGEVRRVLEKRFREKTRKEWETIFDGTDACVAPVLEMGELEEEEYEIRELVGLRGTPALRGDKEKVWASMGLGIGEDGEKVLAEWMGWKRGKHFIVESGALAKAEGAKL